MRLYTDEKLVTEKAGAEELEAALARFEGSTRGSLELRRAAEVYLRATRDGEGGFYLEVSQRGSIFGLRLLDSELGQARAAFQEFVRGFTPKLPWKRLQLPPLKPQGELFEMILGDPYNDDCPLCRAARGAS